MKFKIFHIFTVLVTVATFSCSEKDASNLSPEGTSGSITRFATFGSYMYVLNPNELQTFDISDAENPTLSSKLETDYGLETIFIYEEKIYLGSRTGLYILGLTDPSNPNLLSQTLRGADLFESCDPVVVKDNFAFSTVKVIENICGLVSSFSALMIYDVSDSTNPVLLHQITLGEPNGLGYSDNFLFVCDAGTDELRVFDITDPANTMARTDLDYPIANPNDLIVDNDRMIVSTTNDFKILDISEITEIELIKIIEK